MFNKDNLKYFNQPQEADNWIWHIEHGVGEWVKNKRDKSYWKLVFWVSKVYLKILTSEITIPEFTQLMIEECSSVFQKDETKDTLFHSMEKFKYNRYLIHIENEHNIYVSKLIEEVEALLTKDVEKPETPSYPTLQQRIQEYAKNAIATGSYDEVCVNPSYNGQRVSLSVEKYLSQKFRDEKRHSHLIVFECIENDVTVGTVQALYGKFSTMTSVPSKKLFIASTCSYPKKVQDQAGSLNIGLVLVNLQYEVDEHCFVLPRSSERKDYYYWREMLSGERCMTLPIIACDTCQNALDGMILYFSMKDLLSKNKISVNRTQEIKAPVLYNDDIEEIAMDIIKPQVDELVSLLQRCGVNDEVPPCIIDPYKVAENMGLCIERGYTGDEYALIDIEGRIVTISDKTQLYYHCARFGMGHEVGHYVLHQDVMVLARKTRQTINPKENGWMEQQANHFASCLLMPAPVIRLLFDHFVKRHLGTVSYPLSYKGSCFNNCILGPLAKTMNVSAEAATIRLEKLGLVCSQQLLPSYLPAS